MTETLSLALILVPALIIAIVFHEVAHGLVANALGDHTARDERRLSLNPLRHVDPVGSLLVPGFLALVKGPIFGWAKPVPVNRWNLRDPRYGMVAVAAAGPATNFLLGLLGAIGLGIATGVSPLAAGAETPLWVQGMFLFITINVFIALFNLLPIPPFDGSHIVEGLLPPRLARHYGRLRPFGMALFIALIAVTWLAPEWGVIENTVLPPVEWLVGMYLRIADGVAALF